MYEKCIDLLETRGVEMSDVVECVNYLQKQFLPDITDQEIEAAINSVLNKREVQHAIITGIGLDMAAEQSGVLDPVLEDLLMEDASLYGIDEVLAYGICNLYGSIALTNYGYIDRVKPGVLERLNGKDGVSCHTFLDDIVGAIAAAAASRLAHNHDK